MKLTVRELRCLMDFIQDKRLSGYEESNWYLRTHNRCSGICTYSSS